MTGSGDSIRAVAVLSRHPALAGLDTATLEALAHAAAPRHYDAGQVIFLEGEPATTLYVLESGWVKATRMSPDGREQSIAVLRPVEFFGDIAVYADSSYPGTVTALEPAEVWALDGQTFLDLISRRPPLARAVIRHLAERVRYFIGLVEDLSLRSVEARLASTLLKNAESRDGILIVPRRPWTTYDQMARRLGTVRDVLRRALRNLEEARLVKVDRHQIVLLDPEGLARRGNPQ